MFPAQPPPFDQLLEQVLSELPPRLRALLEEVPLVVEDHPSPSVLRHTGLGPDELCGLYTGIPLTDRSVLHSGAMPDVITIYRRGLLAASTDRRGRCTPGRLLRQIRKTVLHEIGHHFGLDEDDLRGYGYG
jgi:predicted Zn-dependent protease with MMP-like domain